MNSTSTPRRIRRHPTGAPITRSRSTANSHPTSTSHDRTVSTVSFEPTIPMHLRHIPSGRGGPSTGRHSTFVVVSAQSIPPVQIRCRSIHRFMHFPRTCPCISPGISSGVSQAFLQAPGRVSLHGSTRPSALAWLNLNHYLHRENAERHHQFLGLQSSCACPLRSLRSERDSGQGERGETTLISRNGSRAAEDVLNRRSTE